ncbi:MAG TPA: methionine--tRNA ligase [Candidatus Polarisedimenticolia bacterium]|nr:methionine--tRNA ligase [Candidatus Polarisedimenticolia bacterium]
MKPLYVTTPIYYVNDVPHIGHTYTTVVADVIARFGRMAGREVRFLTGTDEHGQKIERSAARQGLRPLELADRVVARYGDLWKRLGITHDDFIRTTEDRHHRGVVKIFERIRQKGDVYLDAYEGLYCTGCEAFFLESQVVDGKCPEQGHPVEKVREDSYFFRLSKYQAPLLKHYEENRTFVQPDYRFNEVKRFVEMGLKDLSISRTGFTWGVPFPGDPRHVFYVWFDALCNYVTALDYAGSGDLYRKFWPADLHLVGKDILRFHAVYWPAFLMSADLPLPKTVFAHGWWLRSDAKMSKSTGNIVDPMPLLAEFGPDALRYFLMREMAFGQDAQFSEEALVDRVNNDLANDLGNLLSRLLKMIEDYCGGRIPAPHAEMEAASSSDPSLAQAASRAALEYRAAFEEYRFHEGLASIWTLVSETNKYLVRWAPWSLSKDPSQRARLETVLYTAAEAIRVVAISLAPVIPAAAQEIWSQLGCLGAVGSQSLSSLTWGGLVPGQTVRRGASLFPRIDKAAYFGAAASTPSSTISSETLRKETTMDPSPPAAPIPEASSTITIDDFMKIKLRVGKIVEAERLAGADKLLKLLVDIGTEKRTVLAGIALQYAPETLVGKSIVLVANLAPRKMRGVESQGMILAADADGRPIVATFEADVPPGAVVR